MGCLPAPVCPTVPAPTAPPPACRHAVPNVPVCVHAGMACSPPVCVLFPKFPNAGSKVFFFSKKLQGIGREAGGRERQAGGARQRQERHVCLVV